MIPERKSPTVFIGWDGATYSILDHLTREGQMPFLASFSEIASRAVLHSTPHPLTAPAWTTLMTGRMPGNHGVFDFVHVERSPDRLNYTLASSDDVGCETIWEIASRQGRLVTALNFISTFPPPAVNGFVVPGFVPWSYLRRAVHPRDLYDRLKAQPDFNARELALDWDLERKALQGMRAEDYEPWIRFHIAREQQWFEIFKYLFIHEPCDLTAVLFDGVDKVQHLCYHLLDPWLNEDSGTTWQRRIRGVCLDYFHQLDGFLEQIVEMAGPEARIFIASDHGFCQAGEKIFYANVWLEQQGYLSWAEGVPTDEERRLTLDGHTGTDSLFDWSHTRACSLTASGNAIYIRKRQGESSEDMAAFRRHLADELLDYKDPQTGQAVVKNVLIGNETFSGPFADQAPDLTIELADHSFLSVLRAEAPLMPRRDPYGTHHPDGIVYAAGPGVRQGAQLAAFSIADITPTLLYSLGLSLPIDLDGSPQLDLFEPGFRNSHAVNYELSPVTSGSEQVLITAERPVRRDAAEEGEMLQRLRALGYLD